MLIFLILPYICLSKCDFRMSSDDIVSIKTFYMSKGQELCINSTIFPFVLVFCNVGLENRFYSYRMYSSGRELELDSISSVSYVPFSIRSHPVESSYTIQASSDGNITMGFLVSNECYDGLLVTSASQNYMTFSSDSSDFYRINPSTKRCIFIADPESYSVQGELKFVHHSDQLCYFKKDMSKICFSYEESFEILKNETDPPVFLQIETSSIQSTRNVSIGIVPKRHLAHRYVLYGPNFSSNSSFLPTPTPISQDIDGFSSWSLTMFFSVLIILLSMVLFASLRYKWCGSCFGDQLDCLNEQKIIEKPRMPSEFIKVPQ